MKYPAVFMMGKGARADVLSVAFSAEGMHQDAGAKVVHNAPYTTSTITSKSISKGGGKTTYRVLVRVNPGAYKSNSKVDCDALLFDYTSRADTTSYIDILNQVVEIEHEATVSKIREDQLFYLMSRGVSELDATMLIVQGFFEPFAKELPMEYAVELNRLIQMEME